VDLRAIRGSILFRDFDDVLRHAHNTRIGVLIDLGNGDSVLLEDIRKDQLQADDFCYS